MMKTNATIKLPKKPWETVLIITIALFALDGCLDLFFDDTWWREIIYFPALILESILMVTIISGLKKHRITLMSLWITQLVLWMNLYGYTTLGNIQKIEGLLMVICIVIFNVVIISSYSGTFRIFAILLLVGIGADLLLDLILDAVGIDSLSKLGPAIFEHGKAAAKVFLYIFVLPYLALIVWPYIFLGRTIWGKDWGDSLAPTWSDKEEENHDGIENNVPPSSEKEA